MHNEGKPAGTIVSKFWIKSLTMRAIPVADSADGLGPKSYSTPKQKNFLLYEPLKAGQWPRLRQDPPSQQRILERG